MKQSKILLRIGIVIAIIVVINLISSNAFVRLDFTADKRYTLSKATEKALEEISEVITITAYFSEDLPPQLLSTLQDFEDQLIEYENRSGGNVVYEFVNPNEDEELERQAQQNGVNPIMINVQGDDKVEQMKAYLGAVIQMGDRSEVIPFVQPGASMEYDLTTAIKKLSVIEKPKVGFLQGHGEPSLNASVEVIQQLSILYDVVPYTMNDTSEIPTDFKALAIINPTDTIQNLELLKLDNYLKSGGGVFVAYNGLDANIQTMQLGAGNEIGISNWLSDKGIDIERKYLIDVNSMSVQVPQQLGPITIPVSISMPFFPSISNFAEHAVVTGLEALTLQFAAPINFSNTDSSLKIIPLAFTSEQTGIVSPPTFLDLQKEWQQSDFPEQNEIVAVAISGSLVGTTPSRMVVVSTGNFAVNGEGEQQQQVNPDNINFQSNAIDWLSDDSGLIDLRTKGVTSRPLDPIDDTTRNILKYGNVFIPILLILLYGFMRKQRNLRKRRDWIEGRF